MIRNKTYRNFLIIKNKLMKEKHYSSEEAVAITHQIFDNVFMDQDYGNRSAEFFYSLIVDSNIYHSSDA